MTDHPGPLHHVLEGTPEPLRRVVLVHGFTQTLAAWEPVAARLRATVRDRRELGLSYIPEDRHARAVVLPMTLWENSVLGQQERRPFSWRGLLNPKAIVFYMAFFPLFVDPARHQGVVTFGAMAVTIAVLTFLYGLTSTLLTHFLAERIRANPRISGALEKLAGVFLIAFGVKLAISR